MEIEIPSKIDIEYLRDQLVVPGVRLRNATISSAIAAYLGGHAMLHGYKVVHLPSQLTTKDFVAAHWHHDRAGRRLKLRLAKKWWVLIGQRLEYCLLLYGLMIALFNGFFYVFFNGFSMVCGSSMDLLQAGDFVRGLSA